MELTCGEIKCNEGNKSQQRQLPQNYLSYQLNSKKGGNKWHGNEGKPEGQ